MRASPAFSAKGQVSPLLYSHCVFHVPKPALHHFVLSPIDLCFRADQEDALIKLSTTFHVSFHLFQLRQGHQGGDGAALTFQGFAEIPTGQFEVTCEPNDEKEGLNKLIRGRQSLSG